MGLKMGDWCYGVTCSSCQQANGIFERHPTDPRTIKIESDTIFKMTCVGCRHSDDYLGSEIRFVRAAYVL